MGVEEDGATRCHMSTFTAMEAESLLGTLLLFFRGKFFWKFDCINVYDIGVLD